MPIRFVYFDIDNTLLDHSAAERAGLRDLHAAHAEAFNGVAVAQLQQTYHAASGPLWKQYAEGAIDKAAVKNGRFARTFATLNVPLDPQHANAFYMRRYATHWRAIDGALTAFKAVAERLPVGVITNGFLETQRRKLARFPVLRDRSAAVIISEETGVLKPHPRLFTEATRRAAVDPADILYVGDSLFSDVQGATRAGWQAAWYTAATNPVEAPVALRFYDWEAFTAWLL
ncbi:MAG: HAD-IA family hydrolase [Bacteroidetes bacterium]|nr:HAD-IA family hydrolase [Bacteroidota bacterium]